jgi:hypothetical protein
LATSVGFINFSALTVMSEPVPLTVLSLSHYLNVRFCFYPVITFCYSLLYCCCFLASCISFLCILHYLM